MSRYLKLVFILALFVQLSVMFAMVLVFYSYISQGNIKIWEVSYAGVVWSRHALTVYLIVLFKRFFDSTQLQIFSEENALRLRKISNVVFGLGFLYAVETYPHKVPQVVELFATSSGSLKSEILAFIIIGYFIKKIADIFQQQTGKQLW